MIVVPGCRLLIKPLKLEEHDPVLRRAKALGIALSEQDERRAQQTVDRGTVLQIGPEADKAYIQGVEEGSIIGFTKYGGKFVKDLDDGDNELLVINDEDVICIFKDNS